MKRIILTVIGALLLSMTPVQAQSLLQRAKKFAKEKIEQNTKNKNQKSESTSEANNSKRSNQNNNNNSGSHFINSVEGFENAKVGNIDEDLFDVVTATSVYPAASNLKTVTTPTDRASASNFHDGVAYIYDYKGCFYIDKNGNKLFDTDIKESAVNKQPRFDNGVVMEIPENPRVNPIVIRDKQGKVVKELKGANYASQFVDGVAMVEYGNGNLNAPTSRVAYVDTKGNEVFPKLGISSKSLNIFGPAIYEKIAKVSDGMRPFASGSKSKGDGYTLWGLADASGNIVVKPCFRAIGEFSDGLAPVLRIVDDNGNDITNPKWSFIDKTGREVIGPKFSNQPSGFNSGYALVQDVDGNLHYIDKTGKVVYGPSNSKYRITAMSPFYDGYASISEYVEGYGTPITSILDTNFNKLASARVRGEGSPQLYKDQSGEYFIVNNQGWLRVDPTTLNLKGERYLEGPFIEGLSKLNNKYFIDKSGKLVLQLEKEMF